MRGEGRTCCRDTMWPICLTYLLSEPLQKKLADPHYRTLSIEVKRMSSNKTLKPFYFWIYILTHAKRKFEPDLFHPIKDLVW